MLVVGVFRMAHFYRDREEEEDNIGTTTSLTESSQDDGASHVQIQIQDTGQVLAEEPQQQQTIHPILYAHESMSSDMQIGTFFYFFIYFTIHVYHVSRIVNLNMKYSFKILI